MNQYFSSVETNTFTNTAFFLDQILSHRLAGRHPYFHQVQIWLHWNLFFWLNQEKDLTNCV